MANIHAIFLGNLSFKATEESLTAGILEIWPGIRQSYNEGKVSITFYAGQKRTAVVSGFNGNLSNLRNEAKGRKLCDRDIVIKADYGEERDAFGNFVNKKSAFQRRDQFHLEGTSSRKFWMLFNTNFIDQINKSVADGDTKGIALNTAQISEAVLNSLGRLEFCRIDHDNDRSMFRCGSTFGNLQAISFLSNNSLGLKHPIIVTNVPGSEIATIVRCKGLGHPKEGSSRDQLVDLDYCGEKNYDIVPLDILDEEVVDVGMLASGFSSNCWRCNSPFRIKGIYVNLTYVSGICNCLNMDDREPFHWEGETFTRLMLGESNKSGVQRQDLQIMHQPMQYTYLDAAQYANIVPPILEEEWSTSSKIFKALHRCDCRLIRTTFVENAEVKVSKKKVNKDIYAVDLAIKKDKIWCITNIRYSVKKVTLTIQIEQNQQTRGRTYQKTEVLKGRVRHIKEGPSDYQLTLQVQLYVDPGYIPSRSQIVHVQAKPDKIEYANTRHFINKWKNNEIKPHPFLNFVLGREQGWELGTDVQYKEVSLEIERIIQSMMSILNKRQLESLNKALVSSVSCIQGPPGTGKSFNISIISIILALKENGLIVVCTPSNESADGVAEKITTLIEQFGLDFQVVRVMSKIRESNLCNSQNTKIQLLHELVQESREWRDNEEIHEITEKCETQGYNKIKIGERTILEDKKKKIEKIIMKKTQFLVMTMSTMGDQRVEEAAKHLPIGTLILDEAGQITQPASLVLARVKANRILLTGDHLQLQPQLNSFASKTAGLNKSPLEWGALGRASESHPPFTVLNKQHRMSPKIRDVVSYVTYGGNLEDADCISTRETEIGPDILKMFPDFANSPILIKDMKEKDSIEEKIGHSFRNCKEAAAIMDIVTGLLESCSVKPTQITILTLYEAQRVHITQELLMKENETGLPTTEISVVNVDAFQGRENTIIILSLVRTNRNIGFSKCPNRLNVAISRAREVLFVVGNIATFKDFKSEVWKKFCWKLDQLGRYF